MGAQVKVDDDNCDDDGGEDHHDHHDHWHCIAQESSSTRNDVCLNILSRDQLAILRYDDDHDDYDDYDDYGNPVHLVDAHRVNKLVRAVQLSYWLEKKDRLIWEWAQ